MYTSHRRWPALVCSLLLLALLASTVQSSAAGPLLAIPSNIIGQSGQAVQAPVNFVSDSLHVAGIVFSLDLAESCLTLNTADNDGNGVPDGVRILAPSAFRTAISFDASDTDGELDVTIVDFSPPFAALPDQTLLTLDFTVICTPAPGETRHAAIGFSHLPSPSFSDPNGRDISGSSQDGAVMVLGPGVETPTPTATASATATPTIAATANPDATATTTATPTVTATGTVAAATPTATLVVTAIGTVTPGSAPPRLYLPLVVR